MKTKIGGLTLVTGLIILLGAGCNIPQTNKQQAQQPEQKAPLLGGDRDAHGCIGSAGYSWCEAKQKCLRVWEEKCADEQKEETSTISYLISKEDPTKYCNGADMDSAGYRKTIITEATTTAPKANMTETELVKNTIIAATTGMCQDVMKQLDFKVTSGTAYIPPIEGWAGVSITMCSCKPQVEVNVLKIPGIKQVIWE